MTRSPALPITPHSFPCRGAVGPPASCFFTSSFPGGASVSFWGSEGLGAPVSEVLSLKVNTRGGERG